MRFILALFALVAFYGVAASQCLIQNIPLNERVANSKIIVEGDVTAKLSFKDATTGRIYTANTIKVYATFKGKPGAEITLFTFGGQVGDRLETANPSLQLSIGQVGVFMLDQKRQFNNSLDGYFGVTGPSSFIQYNKLNRRAIDAFETYANAQELRKDIEGITGLASTKSNMPNVYYTISANKRAGITSFTDTVVAGNGTTLTIEGSGFGSTNGTVGFANADDGGNTNVEVGDDHYFESWTDTKIEVYMPQEAGTGKFYVTTDNNVTYTSTTDLTVTFARLDIVSSGPSTNPGTRVYSPVLDDDNGKGGYTWQFNEDFFKTKGAVKSILRALQNWRCSTQVNFNVDTLKSVNNNTVARDDVHTIMWQNPDQSISTGALAVTFSMWSGCYNSSIKDWHWYLNDVDMVFDDELSNNRTWNYGPGAPTSAQFDMESVALHEFGHAHQLAHIIDADGVMHYSIRNGEQKRNLNTKVDVPAGNDAMSKSTVSTGCTSVDPMKPVTSNCKLIDVVEITVDFEINATKFCVGDVLWVKNNSEPENSKFYWRLPLTAREVIDSVDSVGYVLSLAGSYEIGLLVENSGFTDSLYKAFIVSENPKPLSKVDHVTCAGLGNGEATVILGEGTPPFVITWRDNNSNANPRRNLEPDTYFYTCLDATGCEALASIMVEEPDSLVAEEVGSEPTWGGLSRGKAFVSVGGGTTPYKYRWDDDDAQRNDTAYNLAEGEYTVTVIDDNDCEIKENITVEGLPSGINNLVFDQFIYPNPVQNMLIVNNAKNSFTEIELYNLSGKSVMKKPLATGQNKIEVNDLKSGVYLLKLSGIENSISGKIHVIR